MDASARRMVALGIGVVAPALNGVSKAKWGVDILDETGMALMEATVLAYLGQSAWKEVSLAKVDAAKAPKVEDTKAAVEIVKEAAKEKTE